MEVLENRKAETLLALILKHVHPETTLITDEWKGYSLLKKHFKRHQTVNHSTDFVDPTTGAYTHN